MSEHEYEPDLLPPEPLGDVPRTDDDTEDLARGRYSVADLIEDDLDSPDTPSRRTPDGGAAGFGVPTEPIGDDRDRPTEDTPL